jgi:hypothetical protein
VSVELAELLHRLVERSTRLAELDHARLKVAERSLDEAVAFLEVREEEVP